MLWLIMALTTSHGMAADGWVHPAGLIDVATLQEIRHKRDTQAWARDVIDGLDRGVQPWLEQPVDRLEALLPKHKVSVYWLLICPDCRTQLRFDPFNDQAATCAHCGRTHPLSEDSVAATVGSSYSGTLYDGWGCHYVLAISRAAQNLALLHALGADAEYAQRSADILRIFARHIGSLPVQGLGRLPVIWTYAYEGDMSVLEPLITAYELLRGVDGLLSADDHRRIQQDLIKHWTDAVLRFEQDSSQRHNNMYRWLTTVALAGCALEDPGYVDWAFGVRDYSPQARPEHRSLAWLTENNYLEDGAFWGLCSAYHLYALGPHGRAMVLGRRLSRQMPDLFPPELYDEMAPDNPRSQVARNALKWFTAQCFPDLTMAPFGDMGGRVSLATYPLTAEIGYRDLGVEEVGSYRAIREGSRGLTGLLYGADTIAEQPWPYQSVHLSSGYVALKRETGDNRLYAGLNALAPGSGHSHADRLSLITYSRDRMLSGEKRTRYDDAEQRTYSGASYAHNTVTVDERSQVHGDKLTGDQIPRIEAFVDMPAVQVAEVRGDHVYPETRVYRRLLCQFDEYLVDIFRVEGGRTHDWFFHGVGDRPVVSIPLEERPQFEPASYVCRGAPAYATGATDDPFSVTWRIPADPEAELDGRRRDVFSRVMLAGFPNQGVNILSTYPNPGRYSLMVRHAGATHAFVAVHEAYFDEPVAAQVRALPGSSAAAVEVTHADGSRRTVVYGRGGAETGIGLRGRMGMIDLDARGRLRGLALLQGRELRYQGVRLIRCERDACLSVVFAGDRVTAVSSPPIAYRTVGGRRVFEPGQDVRAWLHAPASLSQTGDEWYAVARCPGQDADGPRPVIIGHD